jgi:hypothetical protein
MLSSHYWMEKEYLLLLFEYGVVCIMMSNADRAAAPNFKTKN